MATSGTSLNSFKSVEFPPSTSQTFFANSNAVGNLDAGGDSQAGSAGTGRPVVHVCYLFAGKHRESDLAEQIKVRLQGEGLLSEIDAFDLLRGGDSHDLSSIALREQIIEDIENKYGIVVSSPPCNTYSRLNWSEDPGPRPIRCRTHPRGFPWLRQRFRWKLETANLLIDFNWEVLRKVHEISRTRPIIALMEHPEDLGATPKGVPATVWQDASFQDLLRQGWFTAALHQCRFGAPVCKPTRFLANFQPIAEQCVPGPPALDADWRYLGPLPLTGHSHPFRWRRRPGDGQFPSSATAAYPRRLCLALARSLVNAWKAANSSPTLFVPSGGDKYTKEDVSGSKDKVVKIAEENTTVRDCKIGRETLPAKGDSSRAAKVNIADTKVRSDDDASSLMIQSRETASHPGQTKVTKRCRLTSAVMPLDDCKIYIGRGSSKFHLQPSMWRNPYRIGADGTRDDCVRKFEDHLTSSPDLLEVIHTLRGKTLVCHCGDHEHCHGDVLVKYAEATREPTPGAEDDATSGEENGQQKPKRGAGWWGHGPPLCTGRGSRHREINDGGELCSPGRWAPSRRKLPPFAAKVTEALETVVVEIEAQEGEGYWSRVVCSLACGKVDTDPLKGADIKAAAAITKLLGTEGFRRDGKANHQACSIDFELLGELARRMDDPDYRMCELMREGVPIGWQQRLPRTPAIYDRKTRWRSHVGEEGDNEGWKANYRSAVEHRGEIEKTFLEQEAEKLMVPIKFKDAKRIYGNRLRVAALGALEQAPGEFRVIHDGTHGVSVNNFIKVRDQEACPLAGDLLSALDAEFDESDEQLFGLVFDASKAHRRVPVAPADWGLQACSLRPDRSPPGPEDIIWLNTVGTYGVGSAAYWWSRPSSLMLRLMHYVLSRSVCVGPFATQMTLPPL